MSNRQDRWSLLLFAHLFCVIVGLFAQESGAELSARLTRVLGPYLRLVNVWSQSVSGYHLTHGMEYEDNHQLVVRATGPSGEAPQQWVWPRESTGRWDPFGFRKQRWLSLTSRFALLASTEDDQALAEIARAVGKQLFLGERTDARRIEFQCRRLAPLERDLTGPEPEQFQVVYTADVWLDEAGVVRVHKRVPAAEAAPVVAPAAAAAAQAVPIWRRRDRPRPENSYSAIRLPRQRSFVVQSAAQRAATARQHE